MLENYIGYYAKQARGDDDENGSGSDTVVDVKVRRVRTKRAVLDALLGVVVFVLVLLVESAIVYWLWNATVPAILGSRHAYISYGQAIMLKLLISLLWR